MAGGHGVDAKQDLVLSFFKIKNNAFPKDWVKQVICKLGDPGLFHNIPG